MQQEARAAGAQRRELARRLVQGQLQIWKTAQAWLAQAEAGVAQASPQADGKQHAPQTSHQAKSHQQRAAAAAAAPSQSGKRKRAKERGCGGAK